MIIFSTGSLYNYGIERVFALAAESGYDGVEVLIDDRWDTRQPAYLHRLSAEYGLPIVALHSPFVTHVQDWPPDQLRRLERTVALAQELSVPLVVTHLPFRLYGITGYWHGQHPRRFVLPIPWPRREPYYHFLQDGRLEEMEATSGTTIAVENMPAQHFLGRRIHVTWFNHPDKLARFPHLTLDTTHLGTWGLEPVEVYARLKAHVAHVHLSNFDGKEHRSPSDGRLRLAELIRHLAHDGYQGAISVEGCPQAFAAEDEQRCRAAIQRALAFCREHFIAR